MLSNRLWVSPWMGKRAAMEINVCNYLTSRMPRIFKEPFQKEPQEIRERIKFPVPPDVLVSQLETKITFSALFFLLFSHFRRFSLFTYLSLPLILERMLRTDVRLTSRAAAMDSSSKCRSSCMMSKMYCTQVFSRIFYRISQTFISYFIYIKKAKYLEFSK